MWDHNQTTNKSLKLNSRFNNVMISSIMEPIDHGVLVGDEGAKPLIGVESEVRYIETSTLE